MKMKKSLKVLMLIVIMTIAFAIFNNVYADTAPTTAGTTTTTDNGY